MLGSLSATLRRCVDDASEPAALPRADRQPRHNRRPQPSRDAFEL